jgi:dTMP kinase
MAMRSHKRARLVVLEGIDGAGKTLLSRELANALISHGLTVLQTQQPTNLPSGTSVRRIALTGRSSSSLSRALYKDRRAQHYAILRPAFQRVDVIICDRYFYSSVYQSQRIREVRRGIAFYKRILPIPDITFLLLPSVMEARRRILSANRRMDGFERRLSFYRQFYYSLRNQREIVLYTKNIALDTLVELCVAKILTKCGVI